MPVPERGKLRGDLLRLVDPSHIGGVAVPEAVPPSHAPTWEIELGAYGTGYGDIRVDGFEARNTNHSSNQDAFAVSANRKRFAVTDGLGGATDNEGTRFLSKYVADTAVRYDADLFFDDAALTEMYAEAEKEFTHEFGRPFRVPRFRSKMAGTVATTLTRGEILARDAAAKKTLMRLTIVGDSPAYRLNSDGEVLEQYGEDAQSGKTDSPIAYKLGIDMQGKPMIPRRETSVGGLHVVDQRIEVADDEFLVLGSDYFSDITHALGRFGQLRDFIGLSPEEFHERTKSIGKPDDATLIAILPKHLA
ncbi:MAG TPA: hypothetical protein VLA92_03950 [Candidatus Saccharimonadales bacterium]|nr:hypothetical protein [Candidatus Saccharimonadales bacterium]